MKTNLLKYYIVACYISSSFCLFAQPAEGNGGSGSGALEGDGDATPAAAIDELIWVLSLIGLLFVFLKFRSNYRQVLRSQF